MRELERDADGNIDKSLIPQSILDWYSDEEISSSESESKMICIISFKILFVKYS